MKNISNKKTGFIPSGDFETGRIMPQNREIEEAVLSALLIEKQSYEIASGIISSEMFYDKTNELIFEACKCLNLEQKPIDMLTVVEQLRKSGTLETIGGITHISELSQIVVSSIHLETHCLIVKEKYLRRKLIEICSVDSGLCYDESEDIVDTIAKLNSEIEQLQELIVGKSETNHISQPVKQSIDELLKRIENNKNGLTNGITTGFADLDRMINGWKPEKLIVMAARPGIGKTSIAIHFARRAAKCGVSVIFFSLEMGATELTDRMIVAESGVNSDEYNSGSIAFNGWEKAESAAEQICRLPIYIDDNAKVTVNIIANKARLLKKQGKCDMIIIDYLQLITPVTKQGRTREQEITEMSRLLKVYAKELKVPFIVLCQMNRSIEGENREPRLSDLRESGSIEQDADIVIFINPVDGYKDRVTGNIVEIDNYFELLVKKHRAGKTGKIRITHNDSMTNFYDWNHSGQLELKPIAAKNYYEKEEETPF